VCALFDAPGLFGVKYVSLGLYVVFYFVASSTRGEENVENVDALLGEGFG